MNDFVIDGHGGFGIPCLSNIKPSDKLIVIISHGFGSGRKSAGGAAVSEILRSFGVGSIRFDFPAHGDSPADGHSLSISSCLDCLSSVEDFLLKTSPGAKISYFSSSFGAYINLLYLSKLPHSGTRSVLRCAALDMGGILRAYATPQQLHELREAGGTTVSRDFDRPIYLTREFFDELNAVNTESIHLPEKLQLLMIHGDCDKTASFDKSRSFAETHGASFLAVHGAGHSFSGEGEMAAVLSASHKFLMNLEI